MTFMLALDELTDAELVDRIATGDPTAAARFWVRHWPTALSAARGLVEPAEVPGLAAEALIGTIATIRVGTGPAEHAAVFVIDAVHELGGDEYSGSNLSGVQYPDVFPAALLSDALGELRVEDQQLLWAALADHVPEADLAEQLGVAPERVAPLWQDALGTLQSAYVRRHTEAAVLPECAATHSFLESAIDRTATTFPHSTWLHLSECVICTEAFHELAHTPVALGPLLGAAAYPGPLVAVEAEVEPEAAVEPALVEQSRPADVTEPAPDDSFPFLAHDDTVAAVPVVPDESGTDQDGEERDRRRRPVLLVLAAAAVAGAIALGISLSGGGDEPTRPSAQTLTTGTPTPSGTPTPVTVVDPPVAHTPRSKPKPTTSPSDTATTASSTTARPSTKPSTSPTHAGPGPTSSPTPPSSPTPTPTPAPTPTCRGLQKLLHLC